MNEKRKGLSAQNPKKILLQLSNTLQGSSSSSASSLILYRTDSFSFLQMRRSSDRYSYKPTLQWNPQVEDYFIKAYGADHFSRISQSLTYVLLSLSRCSSTVFFFFTIFWLVAAFPAMGCVWKWPWIHQNHGFSFSPHLCCRSFLH